MIHIVSYITLIYVWYFALYYAHTCTVFLSNIANIVLKQIVLKNLHHYATSILVS